LLLSTHEGRLFEHTQGDAEPLLSFLVIDENDWVSKWVGAEDNQSEFVQ
jgi:hypothetical protein